MTELDEIAEHAETDNFAGAVDQGAWEEDTDTDPMVSTSLRLPSRCWTGCKTAPPNSLSVQAC